MWGIGSEALPSTSTSAVVGLSFKPTWTTTVPTSKGPATAGVTAAIESGAPLYGPARYISPGTKVSWEPTPAPARTRPMRDEEGQLGEACSSLPVFDLAMAREASEHLPTPAILPVTPGGRTE